MFVLFCLWGITLGAFAQILPKEIAVALLHQNATKLLHLYNDRPEMKVQVEDAFVTGLDLSQNSYEQIDTLYHLVDDLSALGKYLFIAKEEKKKDIIAELSECTLEETVSYMTKHPLRKELVELFINRNIITNLDSLSYKELSYISSKWQSADKLCIENEKAHRTGEIREILQDSVRLYCDEEAAQTRIFLYKIEKTIWLFLLDGYREVARYYSQIGMIPDDVTLAENQYQALVRTCIPAKVIAKKLKKEADQYCSVINQARADYAKLAGKKNVPKLTITIPYLDLTYDSSQNHILAGVGKARRSFVEDREAISSVANVASWFVGFWATIGRGVLDLAAVSALSDKEINCRKTYMLEVLEEMTVKVDRQNTLIVSNIHKQLKQNQNEFINFIIK